MATVAHVHRRDAGAFLAFSGQDVAVEDVGVAAVTATACAAPIDRSPARRCRPAVPLPAPGTSTPEDDKNKEH